MSCIKFMVHLNLILPQHTHLITIRYVHKVQFIIILRCQKKTVFCLWFVWRFVSKTFSPRLVALRVHVDEIVLKSRKLVNVNVDDFLRD